jgi:hypothetical protein
MHPLVAEHPDWVALEREREKLARAQAIFHRRASEASLRRGEAEARFNRELREATLNGTAPPAALPPPAPVGDAHALMRRREELDQKENALLARLADELGDELAATERAIRAECKPLVRQLDAWVRELRSIVSASNRMRLAAGRPRVPSSSLIDAAALVRAVQDGRGFLEQPPSPSQAVSFAAAEQS